MKKGQNLQEHTEASNVLYILLYFSFWDEFQ